jgi:hypothetical protein
MADAPVPSFDPAPTSPRLALPAGACDTHVHVFGPAAVFPYAIAAKQGDYCGVALAPASADVAALRRLDRQGFRAVRCD